MVHLLNYNESIQVLDNALFNSRSGLFKSLAQQLAFISLTPDMQIMLLTSKCFYQLSLINDWKQFLVEAGVLNSLVLIIQDPKKIDTNTIKANDIIIICLECLNEYANYRFDEMKAEIIRSRGSVTLLNLISRDIGDKINELSL